MRVLVVLLLSLVSTFLHGKNFTVYKDITYTGKGEKAEDAQKHLLDIYAPKDKSIPKAVLVFIHGGSWNSGKKDTYKFFGKGFAKKEIVTVIINYRLTPEVNYLPMTMDCAAAVKWVYDSIARYGGDPNKITIAGHSAGGQLAGLIANDDHYFDLLNMKNPIKGCVLIDGFGLDMFNYFPTSQYKEDFSFKKTFTTNPETWKKASPLFQLKTSSPPQIMFTGSKTFPSIKDQAKQYKEAADKLKVKISYHVIPHKGHIGMIFQFIRKNNPLYKTIIDFMR